MSLLKELADKGATTAWSAIKSHPNLLALGTKDSGGSFDDYGGELEIHRLDFSNYNDKGSALLGKFKTPTRFSSLAWSEMSIKSAEFPLGLIAGGMSDGVVNIWDPAKLVANHPQPLMSTVHRHNGSVNSLQFNHHPESTHLLASGGADTEVFIMSLERPDTPNVFVPSPENTAKHMGEVTKVAWNSQVAHILATSGQSGSCIVWDLRQKKPWCELKDSVRGRVADVAWNPDQGLHILTASGDDNNPVLNLWDLRGNYTVPSLTLRGHTQGILSVGWCKKDTSLILSCGKDNRTLLWDLFRAEAVYELPTDSGQRSGRTNDVFGAIGGASGRRYEITWSPHIPALISTCSFDRKVQVFSMASASSKTGRAPRWFARPVGASFGFGGRLISFSKSSKSLSVTKVVENPELVNASKKFEEAMASKDFRSYCMHKIDTSGTTHNKQVWQFMQVIFEKNAREQLLSYLGFSPEVIAALAEKYTQDPQAGVLSPPRSGGLLELVIPKQVQDEKITMLPVDPVIAGALSPAGRESIASAHNLFSLNPEPDALISPPSAHDLFAPSPARGASAEELFSSNTVNIEEKPAVADEPMQQLEEKMSNLLPVVEPVIPEGPRRSHGDDICAPPRDPVEDARAESMIKKALLVGNFEAAVQCCLKNGQMADALILASCGGAELWASTQAKYFATESTRRPFLNLVSAVIKSELGFLVRTNPLQNWEETLATLSTYAKSDEFPVMCEALAERLEKEANDRSSATLCYMCAVNISKTVEVWLEELHAANLRLGRLDPMALHEMVEKVSIFSQAEPDTDLGPSVAQAFATYAHHLAAQGELETAAKYVQTSDIPSAVLKDRLWHACDTLKRMAAPPFPFDRIQINVSPNIGNPSYQRTASSTAAGFAQTPQTQVIEQQSTSQLPSGWQQLADQHGRPYFFNSVTGQSQWEAPPMPSPQTANKQLSHAVPTPQPVNESAYPAAAAYPSVSQSTHQYPSASQSAQQPAYPSPAHQQVNPLPSQQGFAPSSPAQPSLYPTPAQQAVFPSSTPQQTSFTSQQQPGYPTQAPGYPTQAQQPGFPTQSQPGFSAQSQPGYPTANQPAQQPGLQPTQSFQPGNAQVFQQGGGGFPAISQPQATTPQVAPAPVVEQQQLQPIAAAPVSGPAPPIVLASIPVDGAPIASAFNACISQLSSCNLTGMEKKQLGEVNKAMGELYQKLNSGGISPEISQELNEIVGALTQRNFSAATAIQARLADQYWAEHKGWLKGTTFMIQLCSKKL